MSPLEFFGMCVWLLALADAIAVTSSASLDCPNGCRCSPSVTACLGQNLTHIPLQIPTNTKELYLTQNNIHRLRQGSFAGLSGLRNLVLTQCQIELIEPNAFSGLRMLSQLDLRWNNIKEIQSYTFSGLFRLKRLILDSNNLEVIHHFAFNGLNLTQLSLEKNENLSEIAPKAFHGAKIRKMLIFNARLSSKSTSSLINLSGSLTELLWKNNRRPLTFAANLFQGFKFRILNLENNRIRNAAFLEHVVADDLSLELNPVGPIDFSRFPNLRQVRHLHLKSTNFTYIRGAFFRDMTHLIHLYLDDNNITTLPQDLRIVFMRLRRLTLKGNPLHCNCELLWFKLWLSSTPTVVIGGHCKTPQSVPLLSVPEEDFRCKPPMLLSTSPAVNISNSNQLTLSCTGKGDPAPAIIWLRPSGLKAITPMPVNRSESENTGVFRLRSVTESDAGLYRCIARNPLGNVSSVVNVDVYRVAGEVASAGRQHSLHDVTLLVIVMAFLATDAV